MRAAGADVINLGIGSPDLMPPSSAIQAARDEINGARNHGYASYRSTPELRGAMSGWYQKIYGVSVDPENSVLPLLGSKEGILYLSMALLNPGDGVLVPNPGYPAYSSVASLLGARMISYDLTEENSWLPDLAALEKQDLTRCKLMWVNYPHMPTGTSCDENFFLRLIDFARRNRILICNDNPYGLVLNRKPPLSILATDPRMEVSAELNSLSKSFNMAGWRVGMFLGSPELVNAVLQVKSNVDSGMFLPIQAAAVQALGVADDFHMERNRIYEERRELIWKIFDRMGYRYSRDQVGLFVWAKAPDAIPEVSGHLDEILKSSHVFITPGMIFGSNGNRFARASLCAPKKTLEEALRRIEGMSR